MPRMESLKSLNIEQEEEIKGEPSEENKPAPGHPESEEVGQQQIDSRTNNEAANFESHLRGIPNRKLE